MITTRSFNIKKFITISGFSGTLKSTIIDYLCNSGKNNNMSIGSPSKYMIETTGLVLNEQTIPPAIWQVEARQYALKTMIANINIEKHPDDIIAQPTDLNIITERCVYDYKFWANLQNHQYKSIDWTLLENIEREIIKPQNEISILLINNAEKFIADKIISSNKCRSLVYKDVQEYYDNQMKYVDFLKSNKKNFQIIEFNDDDVKKVMQFGAGALEPIKQIKENLI